MRKSPQRESTHILIASDADCDDLIEAASSDNQSVQWIVPKRTRAGDRVIFFHRSKGLLAEAEVESEPEPAATEGRYSAFANAVTLFRHPIAVEYLVKQFPSWGWPTYPRGYVTVPPEVLPTLERLIEKRR
jgi:hypothetical protein